jgi:hypothetical protein
MGERPTKVAYSLGMSTIQPYQKDPPILQAV